MGRLFPRLFPRRFLCAFATIAALVGSVAAAPPVFPDVRRDQRFDFPRDHGAHPDYRTEWWYVTGWLKTANGEDLGFQVTFFRSRLSIDDANPSRFSPRQLLFAHAALADPRNGRLVHDERIAREGFGIAEAATDDAAVVLDGWRFERVPSAPKAVGSADPSPDALRFHTSLSADRFALDLALDARGPLLAEGADAAYPGYSQKGPSPRDASRYYSVPQLAVSGTIARGEAAHRTSVAVTGVAWLDREWSSAYLDPQASGWDWTGIDFDDGGALMAFRMRDRAGRKLWAGGARRFADGRIERYRPADVDFTTRRTWTSPRSRTAWPVAQDVEIHGPTPLVIALDPLMDDQELDSRASTGTIYWEGAVRARAVTGTASGTSDSGRPGPPIGRGYLELTGYFQPMRF